MEKKTFIYSDELNDDFSGIVRDQVEVGGDFNYVKHNWLWNLAAFIVYYIIVFPYGFMYMHIHHHMKIVNRSCLKMYKKEGYYLFGNHTNVPSDGFIPSILSYPKRQYVVVSSQNLAVKGTKNLMQMIGATPVPTKLKGMRNFLSAMETILKKKRAITIYPEAHIWPYYTKVRNFRPDSFRYPCLNNVASFCFTVTYQKRKHSSKPKMTIYCDGPFYPKKELSEVEQRNELHDRIYQVMVKRSANSNYEYNTYIKKKED